ncbi:MAG: ATP-dependent helicase [Planctomycetota bacterium]|nr:ATP-dependent helicase [Planctomycetota bacterium]
MNQAPDSRAGDDFLATSLNTGQLLAVNTTEGPVRVVAGPGTGKTRALANRYCHLVSTLGISPANILCVTFTNRAAQEMKRRIRNSMGDLDLGLISTIHAFCVILLRDDIHVLGYPRNFIIIDNDDIRNILAKVFADMGLTIRDTTFGYCLDKIIEVRKMTAGSYIDYLSHSDNSRLREKITRPTNREDEIFLRYLYEQKKSFACDFNDLINFASHILANFPAIQEKWQKRLQYIMVDEFQDVSRKQYQLINLLAARHKNLFIVGDPDQTIYTWRDSHIKLFLDFPDTHPETTTIELTENYRSHPEILQAAVSLIQKNRARFPLTVKATRPGGKRPRYFHAWRERDEADWVFKNIETLQGAGKNLNDIAILYRAHHLSRPLEERLLQGGIPYRVYSGIEFYRRREIKDALCYLRMLTTGDDQAFIRTINTPPRRLGKKRLAFLANYAEEKGKSLYQSLVETVDQEVFRGTGAASYLQAIESLRKKRADMQMGDCLQSILDLSGFESHLRLQGDQERLDNLAELKRAVEEASLDSDATLEDFLTKAALFADNARDGKQDVVRLMTIHAAKGMEFAHLFVVGLCEGAFPSRRIVTEEEMEEERRLAYVAMTRARDSLFLSDSGGVATDGLDKAPSRFIFDIGRENLELEQELDQLFFTHGGTNAEKKPRADAARFQEGDYVSHPVFGPGKVLAVGESYQIRFDNLPSDRNLSFRAPLLAIPAIPAENPTLLENTTQPPLKPR